MNSKIWRSALITIGGIVVIVGGVFAGQGMNLIPGSFMTGSRMWLTIGLILVLGGVLLLVLGIRRHKGSRSDR